jgi:hypothetical protein
MELDWIIHRLVGRPQSLLISSLKNYIWTDEFEYTCTLYVRWGTQVNIKNVNKVMVGKPGETTIETGVMVE